MTTRHLVVFLQSVMPGYLCGVSRENDIDAGREAVYSHQFWSPLLGDRKLGQFGEKPATFSE